MGFLELDIQLGGTKFNHEALVAAQEFLCEAIKSHDPEWLDNPEGPLGRYWNQEDIESACFLINFADTFGKLRKNITSKSVGIFVKKFKELLRTKNANQFNETFLELQFASAFCELVSPISFEPFVGLELEASGKKPRSPDYAVRLPDGDVQIEITSFHFGALENWNLATMQLSKQLRHLLEKRKISRSIEIVFPIEFNSISLLPRQSLMKIVNEICKHSKGSKQIMIQDKIGVLRWEPILVVDNDSQTFKQIPSGSSSSFAHFVYGFQKQLTKDDYNELFLHSLRNTLDKKRAQRNKLNPYLVVLGLSHHSITVDWVMAAAQERIWPNPSYNWLTGLLIFTPSPGFLKSDPLPALNYNFNPNADIPPTKALIQLLKDNKRFHLRNGKFHSE